MKISFISPTSLQAEYGNRGDFNLTLSHLLPARNEEANTYEEGIRKSGRPCYLDNGLFENGVAEDASDVAWKAAGMNAEYVFAPDVIYDRKGTEESLLSFINLMAEVNREAGTNVKVAGIVQADNPEDFLASYAFMAQLEGVSLIGLSSLSVPKSFRSVTGTDKIVENRLECFKQIEKKLILKQSHILGAGDGYQDVHYAARYCPWIASHDSSSAIWNGVQGKRIEVGTLQVEGGKTPIEVDFGFSEPLTEKQRVDIEWNIQLVRQITL